MKKQPPIPHVAWRDGRPRFNPGPKVRPLGFKGKDLRHEDGRWFTRGEAVDFSDKISAEIAARKETVRAVSRKRAPLARPSNSYYSIEMLIEDWFKSPRFTGGQKVGRQEVRAYAPNTIRDYRQKATAFRQHDPELYGASVNILDRKLVFALYESVWQKRGLATARGVIATLSAAITWGMKRQDAVKLTYNPARTLGMQTPPPRLRVASRQEIEALIAAADHMGRPEVADGIMLGLWTGQRQSDRLELDDRGLVQRRRLFRQNKTGAVVEILSVPMLEARLAASALRRRKAHKVDPRVILDEQTWTPFKRRWWAKIFQDVRDLAAAGLMKGEAVSAAIERQRSGADVELSGREWILQPVPSLADFRDQDLRDTAVTWMARGKSTIPQICAVTGHSAASAHSILKHYLSHSASMGDEAIEAMVRWYEDGDVEEAVLGASEDASRS